MLLTNNGRLVALDVSQNDLGPAAIKAMAVGLSKNRILQELNVGACQAGDEGTREWSRRLRGRAADR